MDPPNRSIRQLTAPRPVFPSPLRLGTLSLTSRYVLSPLASYTNLSFRRIVRELGGVGLATTDLINARSLLAGNRRALELIETCPEDRPLSVQIFGNDPTMLQDAAQLLERRRVDGIDINMGCPVEHVTRSGAGAHMLRNPNQTIQLVQQVVEAVRIPVTVKLRLGWDDDQITAPEFAREFEQIGVAAVTVHGRTRTQGFRGPVQLGGIRRVVEAVTALPVIGNGDVRSISDAARMLTETGCQGVAIGRGALANPWIFLQLSQWEATGCYEPAGDFEQRLLLLRRQFSYLEDQCGTRRAIIAFRKIGHWHLKAMRVRSGLRNRFQSAQTRDAFDAILEEIRAEGPTRPSRSTREMDSPIHVSSSSVAIE